MTVGELRSILESIDDGIDAEVYPFFDDDDSFAGLWCQRGCVKSLVTTDDQRVDSHELDF
jgi:hypothetical protein